MTIPITERAAARERLLLQWPAEEVARLKRTGVCPEALAKKWALLHWPAEQMAPPKPASGQRRGPDGHHLVNPETLARERTKRSSDLTARPEVAATITLGAVGP